MNQRGIRGAVTALDNTNEAVKDAVIELISEIKKRNSFKEEDISHVIFTMTEDLDCMYPAKAAREQFKEWKYTPMMCMQELKVKNSLKKCIRVLIVINTELEQNEIKHVYLRDAEKLREDLNENTNSRV